MISRTNFTIDQEDRLINKDSGKEYKGDEPYAILSLDGANLSNELQDFAPTLASSAQLNRFLNVKDGEDTDADIIIDALKLYNDFKYKMEADELKELLNQPDLAEDQKKRILDELQAATQNIINEAFKPKTV